MSAEESQSFGLYLSLDTKLVKNIRCSRIKNGLLNYPWGWSEVSVYAFYPAQKNIALASTCIFQPLLFMLEFGNRIAIKKIRWARDTANVTE